MVSQCSHRRLARSASYDRSSNRCRHKVNANVSTSDVLCTFAGTRSNSNVRPYSPCTRVEGASARWVSYGTRSLPTRTSGPVSPQPHPVRSVRLRGATLQRSHDGWLSHRKHALVIVTLRALATIEWMRRRVSSRRIVRAGGQTSSHYTECCWNRTSAASL
ncbi:hypothetical protein PENSPDRAFT_652552 [Peniophora sp. CONT]|nr:hypothetical protein PENSPDRAFT_652552 [Peniophora sp. CONT]